MCPRVPVKLEFGRVGFWGEGSPEVPGEKPLGASEKNYNKLNPDVVYQVTALKHSFKRQLHR